jgi:hypothetical protein
MVFKNQQTALRAIYIALIVLSATSPVHAAQLSPACQRAESERVQLEEVMKIVAKLRAEASDAQKRYAPNMGNSWVDAATRSYAHFVKECERERQQ